MPNDTRSEPQIPPQPVAKPGPKTLRDGDLRKDGRQERAPKPR